MKLTINEIIDNSEKGWRSKAKTDQGDFTIGQDLSFADWKGKTLDVEIARGERSGRPWQMIVKVNNKTNSSNILNPDFKPKIAEEPVITLDGKSDRFYMPFVSNTIAHAIQAGLIKTPKDIGMWAFKAKKTAILLETTIDFEAEGYEALLDDL